MLPFNEKEFLKNEVGSTQLTGEPGFSVLERIWARPTLEVHGIAGGFTGGRSEDRDPREGHGQSQHPPGPEAESRESHRRFRSLRREAHARRDSDRSARAERGPGRSA